jgi:hypothetical protein
MSEQQRPRLRFYLTGLVMLAELAHLAWEHFHGGVTSHHILHRADMPAISNWWGALVLPALTWFLTGRIQRRIALHSESSGERSTVPVSVVAGFVGALLFGISLSVAFTNNFESIATYLFQGALLLAILLPIYHAEYELGFVLGMTFTFGAVLPTVVGSVIGALSAVVHLFLRPVLVRLWKSVSRRRSPSG